MKAIAFVFAAMLSASAQSGLNRPFLGQMIDHERLLRPLYGAGGSFRAGPPVAAQVLSAACSLTLCLAKTESAIVSATSTIPAPPGDAKIALDAVGATLYFPETGQFARWQSGGLTPLSLTVNGAVLSMAMRSSGLTLAVLRSDLVWITAADETILDSLTSATGPVLLLPNATVYVASDSLVLRKSDGSELRFPAPGVKELFALGDGYVEAVTASTLYALRTVAGHEQLLQLPEPVPESSKERSR